MDKPSISLVIPARNAESTIVATLESVMAQDYAGDTEVIVSDGSDDSSMADMIRRRYPGVSIVANPDRETAPALNRAINAAAGDIIVRCDAHCILPPHYIRTVVRRLATTGAACVGGMQVPAGDSPFGRAVAMAMSSRLGSGDSRYKVGGPEGPTDTVYLGAWRRATILHLGGFNENLVRNQDYELNWRIRQQGGTVWFMPDLKVEYLPRNGPVALARQYFDYGRWKAVMLVQHPRSLKWRQLAPPVMLLTLMVSVFAVVAGFMKYGLALPVMYAAALVLGTIKAGSRRDPAVVLMPFALVIMHFSWSTGLLISIVRQLIGMITVPTRLRKHL